MKDIILLAALVAFVVAVAWPMLAIALRRRNLVDACNIGEGTHEAKVPIVLNTTIAAGTHHLLVYKTSATAGAVAAAANPAIGTVADLQAAGHTSGDTATISLLGKGGTKLMVANAAVSAGARVFSAAAGKVSPTSGSGIYYLGIALTAAAADNDVIEVADTVPVLVA
jgi:hypothetical protein